MAGEDLVRPSRDGDQFHYLWAARQCLKLLPGISGLNAVTIEGPSAHETADESALPGEQLIDVALYFGAETLEDARLVRYVQLKHSTRHASEVWTASGIKKTITGFAERYSKLREDFPAQAAAGHFRFAFTTNRPIDIDLQEAVTDIASDEVPRHPKIRDMLLQWIGLPDEDAKYFFRLLTLEGGESGLWEQRNLLSQDVRGYLPDNDCDAPVQLKELVTRKATTEFTTNPSIYRHDVLRALKVTEEMLLPAPCEIADTQDTLAREQEPDINAAIRAAQAPIVLHADGGVGKSIFVRRLAGSTAQGSQSVLYDCFGNGLYRNSLGFRHRHRDALVQIANELAARGLCHPLIPTASAEPKLYLSAFLYRLKQAIGILRAQNSDAYLLIIIDAADNAEMAAEEQNEPASFVRDLIRLPLPGGVHLVFTCRTHRRQRLRAPPGVREIELQPFSLAETKRHLLRTFPNASDREVVEFATLSSSNPRVQALALDQKLPLTDVLKGLGPNPTTVEQAISGLLNSAIARLRDQMGSLEGTQIDEICRGLAVLRPLVPISVLATLSGVSESQIRSFAFDLGRPLLVKGSGLHFLDEPAETWFREHFKPNADDLTTFISRLLPLAAGSSYVAAMLPQLLLLAGRLDEVIALALSSEALPTCSPLERRDVELQRLTFALKASLQAKSYMAAAKLSLKLGGERAGERRQNTLIQANTHIAAALLAPDRIEEIVARRTFGAGWMGSHHAYDAGLLSGREELHAEAASRLRTALDWLTIWVRLPPEEKQSEDVTNADFTELTLALLNLRGPTAAARFLRSWRPRQISFDVGLKLSERLADLGQFDQMDKLAEAAGNDAWLLLALCHGARAVGHLLPTRPLSRLLRLLADRRVQLPESQGWNEKWNVLCAITSAIELALPILPPQLEGWACILRRYLPTTPPSELAQRYGSDPTLLLRAYALEAALRGESLALLDVAPPNIRKAFDTSAQSSIHSNETETFRRQIGGLLPWVTLSANILCGRSPINLPEAIQSALKASEVAIRLAYHESTSVREMSAKQWLSILIDAGVVSGPPLEDFIAWINRQSPPLWPDTLVAVCHRAARKHGLESLALDLAVAADEILKPSRDDAEARSDSYVRLSRAVFSASRADAGAYFNHAVEIASRIGDENLDRWAALLNLASAAADPELPRSRSAYRLSRTAELTYGYVARDKHFDWERTVEVLTDLCPASVLAILSRWRDRRFGHSGRLLPIAVYRLIDQRKLTPLAPIVLAGIDAEWKRLADLKRFVPDERDAGRRSCGVQVAYRYMRVLPLGIDTWTELEAFAKPYDFDLPDLTRLLDASRSEGRQTGKIVQTWSGVSDQHRGDLDWDSIFKGVNLCSSQALHDACESARACGPPYQIAEFLRQACNRVETGRESEVIRALAEWPDFGLFELRYFLDGCPKAWWKRPAFSAALRLAVLTACRREPHQVRRSGSYRLVPFEDLKADNVISDNDVLEAILEGYTEQLTDLGTGALFHLTESLASKLAPAEADEALNFGMNLLEGELGPEDGDGSPRPEIELVAGILPALAGYLWAGLGSPVAAERWQHAHAVRAVVELNWCEVLTSLVDHAKAGTAGPFADPGLAFYDWHARQWLLIGLARGAIDNPSSLVPARPLLQRLIREEHVLIRQFAAMGLQTLESAGQLDIGTAGGPASINRSTLPVEVYRREPSSFDAELGRASTTQQSDNKWPFGTDIGPYWFAPLGRVFGVTEKAVERRALDVVDLRMGWKTDGGWKADGRYTRKIFRDGETYHRHGSLPKTDNLVSYHGYHAMMFVAGSLLKERSVLRHAEQTEDPFQSWLTDYCLVRSDGRWISDRRDPRIITDTPAPVDYGDQLWQWAVTADHLDHQLIADDGLTVLWGSWRSNSNNYQEIVSVRSALVSKQGAEALLAALQTAQSLNDFVLPAANAHEGLKMATAQLRGWVKTSNARGLLEEYDPWSEGLGYPGPAPGLELIELLHMTPVDTGARLWRVGRSGKLRSETWTEVVGQYHEAENTAGYRLSGNSDFLDALKKGLPDDRLILSVEIRRMGPDRSQTAEKFDTYPQPYLRYYLMGPDGIARSLQSCP